MVCTLSADRILICGGLTDNGNWLNDVLVFDTKTKITRKVADASMPFDTRNNQNN